MLLYAISTPNELYPVTSCFILSSPGQERYRAITSAYYRGALGAILVYDIAKSTSFQNLGKWIAEVRQHIETNLSVIIVGNKSDLKHLRMVETKRGRQFAADQGMLFMETSALDSSNVIEAFENLVQHIYDGVKRREKERPKILLPLPENHNGTIDMATPVKDRHEKPRHTNKISCCST